MINKLRKQFILIAMTSVTLVMVLLCFSINFVNFITMDSNLNHMLQLIYENQGVVPDFHKNDKMDWNMREFPITPETPYSTRYFVLRYDQDGTLVHVNMDHIAAVTEDDMGLFLSVAQEKGEGFGYYDVYKYYVVSVDENRNTAIFLDCRQELRAAARFALASLLMMALCIILICLLVLVFSKHAIAPIVKNTEKQKQFITNASHELKTPLTVITTSLKVLEMEVGKQKWIDKAQSQTDKMRDLVNDLITLARVDEVTSSHQTADFDISKAVSETAESFQDFAAARGHMLQVEIPEELVYRGNEYAVRQLVSVLLDNAVKYTDRDGDIHLCLERNRKGILLRVSNPCAGIDPSELDKLFDRFYRVEKSRSKQTGGFGVGLSIAQSIVEAHKGSIRAECPDEHSIQFIIQLK